jgi:hypothetical protein
MKQVGPIDTCTKKTVTVYQLPVPYTEVSTLKKNFNLNNIFCNKQWKTLSSGFVPHPMAFFFIQTQNSIMYLYAFAIKSLAASERYVRYTRSRISAIMLPI